MLSDDLIILVLFVASAVVAGGAWLGPRERGSDHLMALGASMSLAFPIGGYLLTFHIYTLGEFGILLYFSGAAGWYLFALGFLRSRLVRRGQEGRGPMSEETLASSERKGVAMTIRILALWTLSFTGPIALVIGGLAPRQKGVMDWVMFSGGALLLATPLSFSFIPFGLLIFSFGFLMDSLGRRQRAKAELLYGSLKAGGDGAQDGSSK